MSVPKPLKSILFGFNSENARVLGKFLTNKEMNNVSIACSYTKNLFIQQLPQRKQEELFGQVLKAKPDRVKSILPFFPHIESKALNECIVLKRFYGKEEFWSESEKKWVCRREWKKKISSLEFTVWAGDRFLTEILLEHVPPSFYTKAAIQIENILKRKQTAENGGFLAPIKDYLLAYYEYLSKNSTLYSEYNWQEIDRLILRIGSCMKQFSDSQLQEFCDKRQHLPIPRFKNEPRRFLQLAEGSKLDLGALGVDNFLFKGGDITFWKEAWPTKQIRRPDGLGSGDPDAFTRFCEVREGEFINIVNWLRNPENANIPYKASTPEVLPVEVIEPVSAPYSCVIL